MKRIKSEEIQNSIQNYVLQRNLPRRNLVCTDATERAAKNQVDLNLMALNDMALIESSIYDYYSFSFNSSSDADYLSQFET